jgi:protein-tyrosine phosphatase
VKEQALVSHYPAPTTVAPRPPGSAPAAAAQNQPAPGTSLGIPSIPNLRDVGGYTAQDGSVVQRGVAYRSNQLNPIEPEDMKKLAALGLKNDFDLRAAGEREAKPDQLPAGVKNVWLNVLADAKDTNPAEVEEMLGNPKAANSVLGNGKGAAKFMDAYRQFITLPSAKAAFRQLFIELAEKNQLPSLFHCTTGKDRSGWAAAALLTLLGVPEEKCTETIYEATNIFFPPTSRPSIILLRRAAPIDTTGFVGRENRVSSVLVR